MGSFTAFEGSVPQNYETFLGPLFFEPYATDLAQRVAGGRRQVLELACGTGRLTRHLLQKLAPDGRLVATDLNAGMLTVAQQRVSDPRLQWSVADAHNLPFSEAEFDLVTCQYGVMFFEDKEKALAEVARVMQEGGRFLFNTWADVQKNALAHLANEVVKETFGNEAPSFFEKGPYSMMDAGAIRQWLERAGFTGIRIETVHKTSVAPSPDEPVNGILEGTPLSLFLQQQGEKAGLVHQRLRQRLVQDFGETGLHLPMQALVCEAVRP